MARTWKPSDPIGGLQLHTHQGQCELAKVTAQGVSAIAGSAGGFAVACGATGRVDRSAALEGVVSTER